MNTIEEDIRRTAEPLRFTESVRVVGDVGAGAVVLVEGSLWVSGSVEDAQIDATGNVTVQGGFAGIGAGRVACGGDFKASFVQGQRVEARGDIVLEAAALSATLFASGRVRVGNRDGRIVGGQTQAYLGLETGTIGSKRAVTTRVQVGIDPIVDLGIEALERRAMELARRRIGFLKDSTYLAQKTDDVQRSASADLRAAAEAVQADLIEVGEEIIGIRKNARMDTDATVTVHQACYPPVEISVCCSRIFNEAETGPVVFRLLGDRIVLDQWTLR
jgi:uncharacterized protein (DUF342 family)